MPVSKCEALAAQISRPTPPTFDVRPRRLYCEIMKNITVSVDDAIYRAARIKAAERDTSVSALVKDFLSNLAADEGTFERLAREEKEIRARIKDFSAGNRLSRDELHE